MGEYTIYIMIIDLVGWTLLPYSSYDTFTIHVRLSSARRYFYPESHLCCFTRDDNRLLENEGTSRSPTSWTASQRAPHRGLTIRASIGRTTKRNLLKPFQLFTDRIVAAQHRNPSSNELSTAILILQGGRPDDIYRFLILSRSTNLFVPAAL